MKRHRGARPALTERYKAMAPSNSLPVSPGRAAPSLAPSRTSLTAAPLAGVPEVG